MSASCTQWAPSTTPPPHHRRRNRCPCGEFCARRELSTPGEVSFPPKAALAVGRVVGGLRDGEGGGLRYRYQNRWQRAVKYRPTTGSMGSNQGLETDK